MKVLFYQTAHPSTDDRIKYHQQVSLTNAGHQCLYAAAANEIKEQPDVVICDTPLALWQARKACGRKAFYVYDITEWYPSKKNMRNATWWLKPIKWCALVLASMYAGCVADVFIFGEYHKALPFRTLFRWKRYIYLPYYPLLSYIQPTRPQALTKQVRLLYAGPKTKEKGYDRAQKVAQLCQEMMPKVHIELSAIEGLSFEDFCREITKHDIFIDLRDDDFENTRCLPIKLFYYMAAGRPVIFSDLKSIRHGVPEIIDNSLIKPNDIENAAKMICRYVSDKAAYLAVCERNRQLAESKYNWDGQSEVFVRFIEDICR
jgi:glycosyltransferase involved in cell wall biosynthesis